MPLRHHYNRCLHPHDARLRRHKVASAGRAHQSSTTPAHEGNTGASQSIDNSFSASEEDAIIDIVRTILAEPEFTELIKELIN